jgi:hypothetical protein
MLGSGRLIGRTHCWWPCDTRPRPPPPFLNKKSAHPRTWSYPLTCSYLLACRLQRSGASPARRGVRPPLRHSNRASTMLGHSDAPLPPSLAAPPSPAAPSPSSPRPGCAGLGHEASARAPRVGAHPGCWAGPRLEAHGELHVPRRRRAPWFIQAARWLCALETHVAKICFKCFRCFIWMLQVFHMDVAIVNWDVAMVVHVCFKLLFSMFQLFF